MKIKYVLVLLLIIVGQINLLNAQQLKKYTNIYKPLEKKDSIPKTFMKIDSKLQVFYSETYPGLLSTNKSTEEYLNEMDAIEFLQLAKMAVQLNYYSYKEYMSFMGYISTPFLAQRKQYSKAKEMGSTPNVEISPLPGGIFLTIRQKIKKEFPWEWGLHLNARLMLIVEVLNKEIGNSDNPKSTNPLYTCKVISDIKGNFKNSSEIKIITRKSTNKMEIGKRYLVLISGNNTNKEKIFDTHLLSWSGADNHSIFKIKNENILDPNNALHFNGPSFSIESYRNHIRTFYEMIFAEADNEK